MSTNHNRIRVADLETNQPNKILKTNLNGELEFSDANGLQTENYNALDCTTEGKTLDARQGKVLKDMIENISTSPVSLVNDLTTGGTNKALTAEMGKQLDETKHPIEDQRLSQDQTVKFGRVIVKDGKYVSYMEPFQVHAQNAETYFSTKLTPDAIIAQSNGARKLEVKYNSINFIEDPYTDKKGCLQTQFLTGARSWQLQDKDGIVALTNDNVVTAPGNTIRPSLIIPNGTLTTTPANGAIERDENGALYNTSLNEGRNKIVTENNIISILAKVSSERSDNTKNTTGQIERNIKSFPTNTFPNKMFGSFYISTDFSWGGQNSGSIQPTDFKIEYFLKLVNGFFSNSIWGSTNLGQYISLIEVPLLNGFTKNETYTFSNSSSFRTLVNNDGSNGNRCGLSVGDIFYNTRKSDNSNNILPKDCEFQLIERITWKYDDNENIDNENINKRAIAALNAFYVEKII